MLEKADIVKVVLQAKNPIIVIVRCISLLCSDSICQEIRYELWEDIFSRKGGRRLSSHNANAPPLQDIDSVRGEPSLQGIIQKWLK